VGSTVAFGIDIWTGFFGTFPAATAWNTGGVPGFKTFASPFAAIRQLGGSATLAWSVQLTIAAAAIIVLVFISRKRPGGAAEISMLVATTGLCVPFFGIYDMVILAVPGAWLVAQAIVNGWLAYERITLALLYISPLIIVPASARGVPLAPFAELVLLALVVRRMQYLPQA